jgi:hypothetical protein
MILINAAPFNVEQKTLSMSLQIVLWLLPDSASHKMLEGLILELGSRYGCPPFTPHMTLLGPYSDDVKNVVAAAETLLPRLKPLRLQPVGIDGEDLRFRCLYSM